MDAPPQKRGELRTGLRDAFRLDRPVPPTPASRWLRRLIVVTALAMIAVETMNVLLAEEAGFSLGVRTVWALTRLVGFLLLMRAVRFGRSVARPFGLILAVTTVFSVARLTEPRTGSVVPRTEVLVGFGLLAVLCATIVWLLYRSNAVHEHLSARPVRRHIPGWVLTARVAVLAYSALVIVPLLIGVGTVFGDDERHPFVITATLLSVWAALALAVLFMMPLGSFFVLLGKGWARALVGLVSVVVLVLQPLLCYLVLGPDGLLRDGVPLIVTALVALVALHRSRGLQTWVRPEA